MTASMASEDARFHRLMQELLRHMQLPLSQPTPQVYSFAFDDGTQINVLSPQPGSLEMIAEAGTVDRASTPVLAELLAMNCYSPGEHPMAVGLHSDLGKVTIWVRQSMEGQSLDTLKSLLETVLTRAEAVRRRLKPSHRNERGPAPTSIRRDLAQSLKEQST